MLGRQLRHQRGHTRAVLSLHVARQAEHSLGQLGLPVHELGHTHPEGAVREAHEVAVGGADLDHLLRGAEPGVCDGVCEPLHRIAVELPSTVGHALEVVDAAGVDRHRAGGLPVLDQHGGEGLVRSLDDHLQAPRRCTATSPSLHIPSRTPLSPPRSRRSPGPSGLPDLRGDRPVLCRAGSPSSRPVSSHPVGSPHPKRSSVTDRYSWPGSKRAEPSSGRLGVSGNIWVSSDTEPWRWNGAPNPLPV